MTEGQMIARIETENNLGIDAVRKRRRDEASAHFSTALDLIEEIKSPVAKRKELSVSAMLYMKVGFYDLAVLASRDAMDLSIQLGDHRQAAEDTLTYGNALVRLGKAEEAEKAFQKALQMCLDNGDYDDAASASTNLSYLAADRGEMDKVIALLKNSLEYLERMPHPDTEMNTRFALVQAMELEQHDPQSVIDMANALHARFAEKLRPDQRKVIAKSLSQTVERYLKAHPRTDGATWMAKKLPYLADWNA